MHHRVAANARSDIARLAQEGGVMNRARPHHAVALGAEHVDRRYIQQARVLRTVRRVAGEATLTLHRGMLVDKRSTLLHVAFGADRVLIGS